MDYAKSKGIQIFNAPGLNANAVAELTISKMLDISRGTFTANYDVKVKHEWNKYKFEVVSFAARLWVLWASVVSVRESANLVVHLV